MSSDVVYKCDKCKKKMNGISATLNLETDSHYYEIDLCSKCVKDLVEYLGAKGKKYD